MDSGAGGTRHVSFKGKQHVPNVWWNDTKREANIN